MHRAESKLENATGGWSAGSTTVRGIVDRAPLERNRAGRRAMAWCALIVASTCVACTIDKLVYIDLRRMPVGQEAPGAAPLRTRPAEDVDVESTVWDHLNAEPPDDR